MHFLIGVMGWELSVATKLILKNGGFFIIVKNDKTQS